MPSVTRAPATTRDRAGSSAGAACSRSEAKAAPPRTRSAAAKVSRPLKRRARAGQGLPDFREVLAVFRRGAVARKRSTLPSASRSPVRAATSPYVVERIVLFGVVGKASRPCVDRLRGWSAASRRRRARSTLAGSARGSRAPSAGSRSPRTRGRASRARCPRSDRRECCAGRARGSCRRPKAPPAAAGIGERDAERVQGLGIEASRYGDSTASASRGRPVSRARARGFIHALAARAVRVRLLDTRIACARSPFAWSRKRVLVAQPHLRLVLDELRATASAPSGCPSRQLTNSWSCRSTEIGSSDRRPGRRSPSSRRRRRDTRGSAASPPRPRRPRADRRARLESRGGS